MSSILVVRMSVFCAVSMTMRMARFSTVEFPWALMLQVPLFMSVFGTITMRMMSHRAIEFPWALMLQVSLFMLQNGTIAMRTMCHGAIVLVPPIMIMFRMNRSSLCAVMWHGLRHRSRMRLSRLRLWFTRVRVASGFGKSNAVIGAG
jgi:hypothetical protein